MFQDYILYLGQLGYLLLCKCQWKSTAWHSTHVRRRHGRCEEMQAKQQIFMTHQSPSWKFCGELRRGVDPVAPLLKLWQLHPHPSASTMPMAQLHCFTNNFCRDSKLQKNFRSSGVQAENSQVFSVCTVYPNPLYFQKSQQPYSSPTIIAISTYWPSFTVLEVSGLCLCCCLTHPKSTILKFP